MRSPSSPTRLRWASPQGATPPEGSTPPQGTYAMGALAGNPTLGQRTAASARRPPAHRPRRPDVVGAPGARRRGRRAATTTVCATACWPEPPRSPSSAPGIGIGHATTSGNGRARRPSPRRRAARGCPRAPARAANASGGSGSSNSPFGNGGVFGGSRQLRQLGQLGQRQLGLVQLLGPERRERHRLEDRPGPRRHQHDARLPAGAGRRNGHRALVQRRDPDQQPRDRRRHEHQRHRHRQPQDLHGQRGGLRPDEGHRGAAAAQRLGPADGDARQLVQRLGRRGRRGRRQRRRHRRHARARPAGP